MKLISILTLFLLTSCNSFLAHKNDLKPMAHDMVDEGIDDVAVRIGEEEKKTDSQSSK